MSTPILDIISSLSTLSPRPMHYATNSTRAPNPIVPIHAREVGSRPPLDQPRIPVELIEDIVDNAADSKASLRSISANFPPSCRQGIAPFLPPWTASSLDLKPLDPAKKLAYDSESATLDLAEVLGHFEGVKDMVWLDLPMVDLHVLRISVDSRRSSLLFLNHLNDFLKKYQKISHLYVWFQDDDQDIVKAKPIGNCYFPAHWTKKKWNTAWASSGSMYGLRRRNTQGLVTRPTITCHLGCHRDRGIPPNSEPCQQFSFGSNNHRASTVHSQLPCGLDGGTVKYSGSKASAKYGIGYWDAQLPMTSGTLAASATQLLPDSILHCPGEFCPFIVANLNARKWGGVSRPLSQERANLKIGTARTAKADTSSQCLELRSVEQGRWAPSKWWKSRRKPTQGTAELSGRWIDRHGLIVSCKIDSFRGLPPTTMVAALPPYIIKDPYLTHLKVHLAQAQFIQSLQSVIGVAEVGAVGKLRGSALGLAR
ncbi:hypothetical protein FA13DRAFT_1713121 [Coprinellus micaceus]|uniref:Uncharacterized protein n=1 Tax=Coprinellus micaceus TaxID=71717 RepID=A0A4Y7SYR5_COPMI|nr:hypothetical protein FA13DRAFT_1713121 [Coprinellus micaceus]